MSAPVAADEAARVAGLTRATFTAYVRSRRPKHHPAPLPVARVGSTPVWDPDEVAEWARTRPGRGARLDLGVSDPDGNVDKTGRERTGHHERSTG